MTSTCTCVHRQPQNIIIAIHHPSIQQNYRTPFKGEPCHPTTKIVFQEFTVRQYYNDCRE
jgi:hypothetical protein